MDRQMISVFAYLCKYNCYLVLLEDTWFVVSLVKQHMKENPLTDVYCWLCIKFFM